MAVESFEIEMSKSGVSISPVSILASRLGLEYDSENDAIWIDENKTFGISIGISDSIKLYLIIAVKNSDGTITKKSGYTTTSSGVTALTWHVFYHINSNHVWVFLNQTKIANINAAQLLIAKDNGGQLSGIITNNTANSYYYEVVPDSSSERLCFTSNTTTIDELASTSIVKAPRIWGGTMFNDLYVVTSIPQYINNMDIVLSNKIYHVINPKSPSASGGHTALAFFVDREDSTA